MKYIFGNWKMYLNVEDSLFLSQELSRIIFSEAKVCIFPNALVFRAAQDILSHNKNIQLGAQNVAWTPQGAYTGALSAELYKQCQAEYAIVGHSERRYIFGESNSDVRKKVEACFAAQITPVVCIGETREDKESNTRSIRLKEQIQAVFENLDCSSDQNIFIAYEPVWAISRGALADPCLPADVEDVHAFIATEIKQYTEKTVPILYGGSVNAENISSYLDIQNVDGVLVGNASTKKEFWQFVSHL